MVMEVIYANFSKTKIARDLKQLTPKYRLEFFFKLLDYTLPKPISTLIEDEKPSQSDFIQNIIHELNYKGPIRNLRETYKQNQE